MKKRKNVNKYRSPELTNNGESLKHDRKSLLNAMALGNAVSLMTGTNYYTGKPNESSEELQYQKREGDMNG